MSQPPQSPNVPGTTGVNGSVDSLADEVTSDIEHAEAQADDEDNRQQQAEPSDQQSDEYDEDYRAPVIVAPPPGTSVKPPRNSMPAPQAQPAETPRPHHTTLSLAAMTSVAVAGLNPTRLALPRSETPERHIIGVIDTRGYHWEVHEAHTDAVGASSEAEAEVLRRIGRVIDDGWLSFDVSRVAGSLRQEDTHIQAYSHVEGKPIPMGTLRPGSGMSAGLSKALGKIHELSVTVISEAGVPVYDAEEAYRHWLSLLDDTAAAGRTPPVLLGRWEQTLEDTAPWHFHPMVVHGDLAEGSALVVSGTVVTVRG